MHVFQKYLERLLILLALLTAFTPHFFASNGLAEDVNEAWVARYSGPGNGNDWTKAMVVDGGGNIYVTGTSTGSGTGYDYATIKYDPNGSELWAGRYNGPGNGEDWAQAIAIDANGNVYVTGFSYGSETGNDWATIKYDSSGNELWVKRYPPPGPSNFYERASAIAVDSDGNVYVTGMTGGSGDYATIKYDTDGNELWVRTYNGPGNGYDNASTIAVDGNSNVYVAGLSTGDGPWGDFATVKYDTNGNELWVSRYDGPAGEGDAVHDIAIDSDSNVYVTGYSYGSGTSTDFATIKYDADGNELWVRRYDGPGSFYDSPEDIAIDSAGNVYVTGVSWGSATDYDYATIKYDPSGNELWVKRYNRLGSSWDWAYAITIDGSGNAYVTGDSGGIYVTLKYDPNGNELWLREYAEGAGVAYGYGDFAIAVDAGKNVYVAGYNNRGTGTGWDYTTIKYSILFPDTGPITSSLVATPEPVPVNIGVTLTANVDDSTTGSSNIASAEYSLDGGSFLPMSAIDGTFDEVSEDVTANIGSFAQPGVHTVGVRGTDSAGNVGGLEYIVFVVYDPTAGFVTGGGWIASPAGAYTLDPTLIGKATFDFVSKYQKGATIPTGRTEFQFCVGNLNFHSATYEWLAVAGAGARYKGSGTINGEGDYGFMLIAIDGQISGGIDKLRIKIWDKLTYNVVYDNKLGSLDAGYDTTELGGGSIVIHK